MATIFLSYRRTDSPQACRVYNWLVQRFGHDAVFMDVNAIPFAVSFPDFIRQAIASSKVMIVLIGPDWLGRLSQEEDPVRMEIQTAVDEGVPLLPVTIGTTPMPSGESLPPSIALLADQNALSVGVLHDFDSHMRAIVPKIESILGRMSAETLATTDPSVIHLACNAIIMFLTESYFLSPQSNETYAEWRIFGTNDFSTVDQNARVTLYLHRVVAVGELLELHFILSFWAIFSHIEHLLAGWILHELERTPIIPTQFFGEKSDPPLNCSLKIRRSDEDARQIWRMITDNPLRLSLAYVATVSPNPAAGEPPVTMPKVPGPQ